MSALLRTKIQLPPLRSGHVTRKRVLSQFRDTSTARLLLMSAPAGFGKSTALIQWAHELRAKGAYIAWYALDERDDDPARFAAYLLESFRSYEATFSSLPDYEAQPNLQDAVDQILNAATGTDASIVLMLDDYHLMTEPRIHDAIGRMVDHMPPNMRLAIGTRADPPLQLARLRVCGEIAEIRMHDLRFNTSEMHDWLNTSLGWHPARSTIAKLDTMTEGWAAAVALILMSQSYADDAALTQQLARFSQSRRHLFEYFAQEILDQQPDHIRDFLLDTCILNRLEPNVCQAMTNQADAPLLLNQLATGSLFVIPLSDTEPIYRYHHLFADFLRQYLEMKDSVRYLHQHQRAVNWFTTHSHIVEAVHHALAADDHDTAATLITDIAWEALTARGEVMTVIHWLRRFPDEQVKAYPRLCLYFSRALYLTGAMDQSQHYVQIAIDALADEADEGMKLRAIAYGYQATLAAYRGDVGDGLTWIDRANQLLTHVDGVDRVRIANTDAFLRYLTDSIPTARRAYTRAQTLAEAINHNFLTLDAHFYLAQIDFLVGDLQAVVDRCESVLGQSPGRIAPLSAIMLPLARAQYQRNQIVEAEATLRDAVKLARRANLQDILWFAYINLAEVVSLADLDEAMDVIAQAHHIAADFHSPVMASIIGAADARLKLRAGRIDEATDWARQFKKRRSTIAHHEYEMTVLAAIHMAQGKPDQALTILGELINTASETGRLWYVMVGRLLQARTHQIAGDIEAARPYLEAALTQAQPQRVIRLFLDEGQPMMDLLQDATRHGIVPEYAAELLDIAARPDSLQHPADMLTEREIEVLQHVAAGASNNDIADTLALSIGTVKSHIHHIMNKLDAQNRTEAVSKARSLNILPN